MMLRAMLLFGLFVLLVGSVTAQGSAEYAEIQRIGRGKIDQVYWSPDCREIAVTTVRGIWFYQSDNLTMPPRLLEVDYGELDDAFFRREFPYSNWTRLTRIAFDAHWIRVAVAEYGGGITLRDTLTGEVLTTLNHANHTYLIMTFSEDGKTLAAALETQTGSEIDLWDIENRRLIRTIAYEDLSPPRKMVFSPDGRYLAVSAMEMGGDYAFWEFYLLDIENGDVLARERPGNNIPLPSSISAEIPRLVVVKGQNLLGFDTASGETGIELLDLEHDVRALSSDFVFLANDENGTVQIQDLRTGEVIDEIQAHLRDSFFAPFPVAFSPDDRRLVMADSDDNLTVKSLSAGPEADQCYDCAKNDSRCVEPNSTTAHRLIVPELHMVTNTTDIRLAGGNFTSPDRRWLVKGGQIPETPLELVRLETEQSFDLTVPLGEDVPFTAFQSAAFSPDGHWMALTFGIDVLGGTMDATTRVWDVGSSEPPLAPVVELEHRDALNAIAFSPDSRLLAVGVQNGEATVWRTDDWSLVDVLPHPSAVTDVMFSEDSKIITTLASDGLLRMWSPE